MPNQLFSIYIENVAGNVYGCPEMVSDFIETMESGNIPEETT